MAPFTLSFEDRELEARYQQLQYEKSRRIKLVMIVLGLLFFIAYTFVVLPLSKEFVPATRFDIAKWIGALALLFGLYRTVKVQTPRQSHVYASSVMSIISGVVLYFMTSSHEGFSEAAYSYVVVMIFATYVASRLPPPLALAIGLVISVSFLWLKWEAVSSYPSLYGGFIVASNILGFGAAYMIERSQRISFLFESSAERERARSEELLLNILPSQVAERLKNGEAISERFDKVTVVFTDLVGFTSMAKDQSAERIVELLNELFSQFDMATARLGVEKIKTIGDAYMAVSGLPDQCEDHADRAARLAFAFLEETDRFNERNRTSLQIRIGIHSGSVVAGVIGKNKFVYDLWGDTVNIASRMESHSEPGVIQISAATRELLGDRFACTERGVVALKGCGGMRTYFLKPKPTQNPAAEYRKAG